MNIVFSIKANIASIVNLASIIALSSLTTFIPILLLPDLAIFLAIPWVLLVSLSIGVYIIKKVIPTLIVIEVAPKIIETLNNINKVLESTNLNEKNELKTLLNELERGHANR